MDDKEIDLAVSLFSAKHQQAKRQVAAADKHSPYPGHPFVPRTPLTGLTLIVHEQRCRNCGNVERYSNRHLLATYAPPAPKGVSSQYTGTIPAGVPIRKLIHQDVPMDFCDKCFGPMIEAQDWNSTISHQDYCEGKEA